MITSAFHHCRGIGPARLTKLMAAGVHSWHDAVGNPDALPASLRKSLIDECRRLIAEFEQDRIDTFVRCFHPKDKWRILHHYLDRASFFDIETTGLSFEDTITVIVCWHRGELHSFVEHENLDEFLELLDDVDLLVSFNGNMFDVPRVLDAFHIPELPCPHLDLRWIAHHQQLRGSLKSLTCRLGIERPHDLRDVDGAQAVHWWWSWKLGGDEQARADLLRYCAADVLLMLPLAEQLSQRSHFDTENLWSQLADHSAEATTR